MKNTLIVGWHQESINLYNKIREFPALGYEVKGFITVGRYEPGASYNNIPLLGELNRLSALIEELDINEILIAIIFLFQESVFVCLVGACLLRSQLRGLIEERV